LKKTSGIFVVILIIFGSINAIAGFQNLSKEEFFSNVQTHNTWKHDINFSDPELINKNEYVKIEIKEAKNYIMTPGSPMIPYYSFSTAFPLGTKITEVKCSHSQAEEIPLSKEVCIVPQLQWQKNDVFSRSNDKNDVEFSYDITTIDDCYSYKTGGGLLDGEHVTFLNIHLYPVSLRSDEKKLDFIEEMEIEVYYEEPVNPLESKDSYSLVMISTNSFSRQLEPLVDHKNRFGLSSKIVILDDIYNGKYFPVQGVDDLEKIKFFIKDSIENWGTTYVMLVGDISRIPIRYSHVGDRDIPTDLYFADVFFSDGSFSSWDTNDNGRYGEFWQSGGDDVVDLYPDVYIGRLACRNIFDVRNSVKKIIRYEENTYGQDWYNNLILVGGDTHPSGNVYEGEVMSEFIEDIMPEFTPKKLYTSVGTYTPKALTKALNDGAGFMSYSGHGFEISIGTHPPKSQEWVIYDTNDMLGLLNYNKLPIIFFDACLTGRLDLTLGSLLNLEFIKFPIPCFAWSFIKKIFGGGIATIGATRIAYSWMDENGPHAGCGYLSYHFFKNYERGTSVANMLVNSQNHYLDTIWEDPMTVEEFLLFGDPSLKVGGYND